MLDINFFTVRYQKVSEQKSMPWITQTCRIINNGGTAIPILC